MDLKEDKMKILLTVKELCDMAFPERMRFLNYCEITGLKPVYVSEQRRDRYYLAMKKRILKTGEWK